MSGACGTCGMTKNVLLAFGIGAVVGWLAYHLASGSPASARQPAQHLRPQVKNAFYLGVGVRFPTDEDQAEFERIFAPLAAHVEAKELGTLSYILMKSDKEARHVMILERYESKDYYLNVHKSSDEFKSFRDKFQQLISKGAVVDGHSYLETDVGYI